MNQKQKKPRNFNSNDLGAHKSQLSQGSCLITNKHTDSVFNAVYNDVKVTKIQISADNLLFR